MISLSTLKKPRAVSQSREKLQPLGIGFKEDSTIVVAQSGLKKKFRLLEEQLRVSGFYTNYWMWNIVFLNLLVAFVLGIIIFISFGKLPSQIGFNVNNDSRFDTITPKEYLFLPVVVHLVILLGIFLISFRSQKKLNHLYMVLFFQQLVLAVFEFIAVRNLIAYFI